LQLAVGVLGVGFVVVAASGLWLSFNYRPGGGWVKDLHVAAGWISLIAAAAIVVALVVAARRKRTGWTPAAAMSVVVASMLGAVFSGRQLAWVGVGLREVSVAKERRGVWFIVSHDIALVSIGSGPIDPSRYRMLLAVHIVIVPIASAVAALAVVASRRARRRGANAGSVEAGPPDVVEIVLEPDQRR